MGLWIQNFKQALRGLRHQGWQAVVSVAGLAVSIVCLTFSVNWLWTETHYDSSGRTMRICMYWNARMNKVSSRITSLIPKLWKLTAFWETKYKWEFIA